MGHLEESLGQEHHIGGSHNQGRLPGNLELAVLAENSHQIGRSEDDPYPTEEIISTCSQIGSKIMLHTLHFKGRPLTL